MSIRFRIRNWSEAASKEGDTFVRFSGKAEPYSQSTERLAEEVGVDGGGNPKLVFVTGLNPDKIDLYHWYSEEERKEIKKQLKEALPALTKAFGGSDVLEETNAFFWKKKREVNRLVVTHESDNYEFDTKNPAHALLYFGIMAGAFMEVVAPTLDYARRKGILHYLHLETDDNVLDGDAEITRADAYGALSELRKDDSVDALFILAWCLQYDTTAFGAYTKSAAPRTLVNYHIQYIDGKLKAKGVRKINFPKQFLEYAEKWKGPQTRAKLFTEAYVKSGEYYSFINRNKENKLSTVDGTVLGNTIADAVENLHKPKFQSDYEKLRELIEAKWKE